MTAAEHDYIFDWNRLQPAPFAHKTFELFDETLRDGLQSPSITDPPIAQKIEILHLMASLGIRSADIGLPGAGQRAFDDTLALAQEIVDCHLPIKTCCAARTVVKDVQPIVDIAQRTGRPIEVYAFIGSSPIRFFAEDWTVSTVLKHIEAAVTFAVREGLAVCLVTEDTTRSSPDVLEPLFRDAIGLGVSRLCLCDTVGHATPDGIKFLFGWAQNLVRSMAAEVKLDWHGHNDRGLAVTNALCALEYGADRAHGTGLGVGERVGNAAMDQILVNLKLLDAWPTDLSHLLDYCQAVAKAYCVEIPYNYPLAGRDAFRTGTGVHAAAIIKAQKKGDQYLADRVYSGVPAGMFGRRQEIEIGPMSGVSNVVYWLQSRELPSDDKLVQRIFAKAKGAHQLLSENEIMALVADFSSDVIQRVV